MNFPTINGIGKCVFHQSKVVKDQNGKVFGVKSFYMVSNLSLKIVVGKWPSAVEFFVSKDVFNRNIFNVSEFLSTFLTNAKLLKLIKLKECHIIILMPFNQSIVGFSVPLDGLTGSININRSVNFGCSLNEVVCVAGLNGLNDACAISNLNDENDDNDDNAARNNDDDDASINANIKVACVTLNLYDACLNLNDAYEVRNDDVNDDEVSAKVSANANAKAKAKEVLIRIRNVVSKSSTLALEFISKHCSFSKQPARDAGFELLRCGDVHPNPGPGLDPGPGPEAVDGNVNGGHEKRITKCHLQVISQNVRGLGESKKVRHLINRCYKLTKNASNSIFLFQETYVTKLDLLNYLWRGEHHVTMGNGNSLGCITLVTAPYKIVKSHELGQRGHVLVLAKDDVNKAEVIVANVYAPNGFDAEKLQFFENVFDLVEDLAGNYNWDKVLLAGDLNLVFNDAEVQNRAISAAEVRVSDAVKLILNRVNLIDGWSCAAKRSFTWTSNRTGTPAFSTLDRVLFTKDEFDFAEMIADW